MLENFQGDSWGSIPPLRMPSLLPHDLCHGRSSSHWLPAVIEFQLSYSRSWKMMLWKVLHSICNTHSICNMPAPGIEKYPSFRLDYFETHNWILFRASETNDCPSPLCCTQSLECNLFLDHLAEFSSSVPIIPLNLTKLNKWELETRRSSTKIIWMAPGKIFWPHSKSGSIRSEQIRTRYAQFMDCRLSWTRLRIRPWYLL